MQIQGDSELLYLNRPVYDIERPGSLPSVLPRKVRMEGMEEMQWTATDDVEFSRRVRTRGCARGLMRKYVER